MNELHKELVAREIKNEIKENLRIKLHRFFFVVKAVVTLILFISFEYLILTRKMTINLNYILLQVIMVIAIAMIVSCFVCILQAMKHQCFDNLNKFCTLFATAMFTIFAFSLSGVLVFLSSGSIVSNRSSFYDLAYMIIFNLLIFRFFQFKSGKERLRNLGFKLSEEKLVQKIEMNSSMRKIAQEELKNATKQKVKIAVCKILTLAKYLAITMVVIFSESVACKNQTFNWIAFIVLQIALATFFIATITFLVMLNQSIKYELNNNLDGLYTMFYLGISNILVISFVNVSIFGLHAKAGLECELAIGILMMIHLLEFFKSTPIKDQLAKLGIESK